MSHTFNVGEIVLIHRPGHHLHGTEVTVVEGLHMYAPINSDGSVGDVVEGYTVSGEQLPPYTFTRGRGWGVEPQYLRKRRPPQDWVKLCNLTELPSPLLQGEIA